MADEGNIVICGPDSKHLSCVFSFLQGWFSPGQVFVLDEYCARYGVRGCHRHLSYLKDLMDYSENNVLVDPTLLHYSYAFCASHVHGNRYAGRHCKHHVSPLSSLIRPEQRE